VVAVMADAHSVVFRPEQFVMVLGLVLLRRDSCSRRLGGSLRFQWQQGVLLHLRSTRLACGVLDFDQAAKAPRSVCGEELHLRSILQRSMPVLFLADVRRKHHAWCMGRCFTFALTSALAELSPLSPVVFRGASCFLLRAFSF
jgi:hypothetical protein